MDEIKATRFASRLLPCCLAVLTNVEHRPRIAAWLAGHVMIGCPTRLCADNSPSNPSCLARSCPFTSLTAYSANPLLCGSYGVIPSHVTFTPPTFRILAAADTRATVAGSLSLLMATHAGPIHMLLSDRHLAAYPCESSPCCGTACANTVFVSLHRPANTRNIPSGGLSHLLSVSSRATEPLGEKKK